MIDPRHRHGHPSGRLRARRPGRTAGVVPGRPRPPPRRDPGPGRGLRLRAGRGGLRPARRRRRRRRARAVHRPAGRSGHRQGAGRRPRGADGRPDQPGPAGRAARRTPGRLVAAIVDARRGEVFWALYRPTPAGMRAARRLRRSTSRPTVAPSWPRSARSCLAVGDGARRYASLLRWRRARSKSPARPTPTRRPQCWSSWPGPSPSGARCARRRAGAPVPAHGRRPDQLGATAAGTRGGAAEAR